LKTGEQDSPCTGQHRHFSASAADPQPPVAQQLKKLLLLLLRLH
jgi:hypothetical protein